jgi:hypothetical protein
MNLQIASLIYSNSSFDLQIYIHIHILTLLILASTWLQSPFIQLVQEFSSLEIVGNPLKIPNFNTTLLSLYRLSELIMSLSSVYHTTTYLLDLRLKNPLYSENIFVFLLQSIARSCPSNIYILYSLNIHLGWPIRNAPKHDTLPCTRIWI